MEPTSNGQSAKPKRKRPAKSKKKKQAANAKSEAVASTVQADGASTGEPRKKKVSLLSLQEFCVSRRRGSINILMGKRC